MDTGGLSRPCFLLLISVGVSVVSGTPVATSTIDCTSLNDKYIGAVTEGYTGDVEVVEGIKAGHSVELVPFVFPDHLEFLELNFTLGDTVATIRTRKPLDADALTSSDRTLYYGIRCDGDIKYINSRTLRVYDINDNHPIFHHDLITANISEATDVGSEVLRVTAVDHDSNPANYLLTYSIEPSSDDFLVTDSGAFILMKRLNYNVVQTYNFTLTAKDSGGLNDTVTVVINVEDYDDYNPHFSHSMYHAFIPENNRGSFRAIEPAAIRAQDGDTGINMSLLYSISAVSPAKYTENFNINRTSGELSLKTAIDREEMKDNVISVFIQAFQSDDILKTADSVVFVTVEDVNDNVPEFDQSSYSVSLLENSPVDAVVLKAIVTDQDEGGFVGNLRILPESAPFYISADGTVKVKNSTALDREITDTFTFQIEANETNSPNHVAVAQVSVNILDENDNSPEFTSDKYNASVTFGNQKEGMLLVQVAAIDPDLGANAVIKYSIDFGNDDGYFSIEKNTGKIMLAKTIPLVENQFLNFLLYVSASDGGIKSRSSSAQVNIHAAGKSIPQFLQTAYKATIEEEQDPGTVILKVDFLPKTGEFPVDLQVDTESDKFSISSSGELTTNVKFDYDEGPKTYSVEISISDRFNNSGYTVVEVEVTDINDNSPLIHTSPIAPVPENAEVGTNVTVIEATDKDSGFNKEIRYWLSGGEGSFAVDPVSGLVSVTGALDRETKAEYNLQVVAEDRGHPARLTTTSLLVRVSDVNDNVPKFSQAEYQAEPLETMSVGEFLLNLSALDPDEGVNGNVTYSILQQRPQSNTPVFELDSSNGALRLAQPLDYSKVKMYRLTVEASDGGSPSQVGNSTVVVRVKGVNNNRPEFSQESYDVAIPENLASNVAILTVKVTDRDEGRFVGTLQILSESAPFSISPDGTIRVKNSTHLDRETTERIVFEVEARETEQPDHVAKVNVTVTLLDENDNSPEFTSSKYETKVSNQTQRMLLMRVEAKDPDAGVNGQIKYSIDFGNENGYFSIDANTGAIHLAKIIPVDVHQTLEFLLLITARDGGIVSRSATAQVKIVAVGDMKPQFTHNIYSVTIEEETVPGTKIFKVDFLATGEIPVVLQVDTESDKFNISSSGELTTEVKLDYDEGPKTYSVKISISDGVNRGYAFVEVEVTDINDNSPIFNSVPIASVLENAVVGTNVTVVVATDKDSGFNKEVRYWLNGGEGSFAIDPVSGLVSVIGALDRETKAEYNLQVVAEDRGHPARSTTTSLPVQVSDVNDNVPKFSQAEYQVKLPETESVGAHLLTLAAVDLDEGVNGNVTYSILRQRPRSDTPVFELDSSNGALRLAQPLGYSKVKMYRLIVEASDGGSPSLVGSSTVVVRVKDVNNNRPEFSQESYNVTIPENLANGVSILTLEVTDSDKGRFVGTLQVLSESAPFSISPDGTIRVKNSTHLDRETTERIVFEVEARETEQPDHVAKVNVTVTLLDENDNSPEFTSSKYETKVSNQTQRMLLMRVEAKDPDAGVNGQIKYSIDFGNENGYFSIDANTGAIHLAKIIPVDVHQTLEFLLLITARDGGIVSRSATAQVKIVAVGDMKPQFTHNIYSVTIEEETVPGTKIFKVDFLATGEIPVVLQVDTESDKFNISSSGELTTEVKLDYDEGPKTYSVKISISDGVNRGYAFVEVEVTDINDNSPIFNSVPIASVLENAVVGTNVTVVVATDKDSGFNKEVRYWLNGGEGSFAIDPVSGLVSVIGALDRETKAEYNLQVVAEDRGHPARSTTTSLPVQVSDVNDNVPKFSQAEYQVKLPETESVGAHLLTLAAVDLDEGVNGNVTYSILRQRPRSDTPVFELDSSNGALRLAQPLGYSKVKMYRLIVEASDGGSPSLVGSSTVVVRVKDVNNNRPEFSQESYNVTIPENLANGVSILTLEVTDSDKGRFVGTLQVLSESAPFSISPDGTIRVKNSTHLDRETTERIVFEVEARETEQPDHVAKVNVTVTLLDENDNSPEFTSSKYETKVSNQTQRMLLMRVEAKDPDAGVNGQIKYSIDFGNENGYFSIDANTGAIHLAKIIPVDVHQTLEFLLLITARDGGIVSRSATAQVEIVAVGDMKPQFTQNIYSVTIEEETVPGTKIFKVDFLATGEIPVVLQVDTESDKFNISSSGELTTEVKLDYDEGPKTYSVKISISDGVNRGYAFVEVEVTDINDNSPIFNSVPIASVLENTVVGTNVTVVVATDKDSGFNKEVRYWLNGGEGSFAIDPVSGLVSVIGALDRETKAEYNLQVVAEDQGHPARSTTTSLPVQVSDVNDNVPKFSQAEYQVKLPETESVGELLLTLAAVDPDEGVNGNVTYSILRQRPRSDTPVFELDSSNGALRLAQPLDYSKAKMYRLIVEASDGGSPSLVGNSTVVVRVEDVNNNPPEFSQESYIVTIPENLASGMSILTLEVTDRDEGGFSNGYFEYTNDTFDINEQGVVSLRKDVTLDRETITNYVFEVVAVDQATDGLRATAQLNITVLDYNDNTPQFPAIPDTIRISEKDYSEKSPGKVATIMPTDADLGPNGEVTLSLFPPHPLFKFTEDGTLLAVGSLDRERMETYDLVVKASDKGSPQRENITTIRVSLIDVNDNRPEFSSSSYFSTVMLKDAEQGKLLLTLSATDRDAGENALVTYSFCEGSSQYLALDSKTGTVTLTSDFANVAEDTVLQLTAMATDHGQPPLNSTARVVVELRAVRGVAFLSSFYNFSIPENKQEGTMVGKVTASSENNLYNVTYALKTHTDQFSIGADGTIQTRTQLDKEEQDWYLLDVEAVDTRIPPTSATAVVMVQVEDVNEPPVFLNDEYEASLHSIAPYKTPVVQVQALDPDVGHQSELVYSMTKGRPYFDVEPSTGLVYVVSVVDLGIPLMEMEVELEVKATDPKGRSAKTTVEVEIRGDASSSNVVVIFINRPAYAVEKKVQPLEKSLRRVLKWDVGILEVSSANGEDSRQPKASASISFVCVNKKKAISSEMVIARLESKSDNVQKELRRLFGKDLQYHVGASQKQSCRASNHPCCDHKSDRRDDDKCADVTCCPDRQEFEDNDTSDKERSDVDGHDEGSMDESHDFETSEQGRMESPEKAEGQVEEEGEKKDGQ